ncbi:MAG: hypothetical protein ACK5Y7_12805 [Betaproteobacteria bacterium]
MLLLGLIGGLALVLPLAQVLLYQVDALHEDRAELARLDPLAEALAVQRGLAEHGSVAELVLRGRPGLEPERQLRQQVVDRHVSALRAALPPRVWPLARREADGLATDWGLLARAVGEQRLGAADSGVRHRLLQEQAVQVMDLVEAHAPTPDGAAVTAGTTPAALARQAAVLDARRARLQERIARQAATRDLSALALVGALGLLAALALAATGARRGDAPPPGDAVRRSHGRRAADRAAAPSPAERAAAELEAVRRAAEDARSGS